VEDYHVDRLGVEVQQCMKLTSTNSPIGLIVLIAYVHRSKASMLFSCVHAVATKSLRCTQRAGLPATDYRPVWEIPRAKEKQKRVLHIK